MMNQVGRPSLLARFMRMSGSISGGRDVRWWKIPLRKTDSYADILGVSAIGNRHLRISSTAVKAGGHGGAAGGGHASARDAH